VYPHPEVAAFVRTHFVPVRLHIKDHKDEYQRVGALLNAQWTPTILLVDPPASERHRIEGFLPVDDFLSQLKLGLAKTGFARGQYADAEREYREIVERYPNTEAAPEAQYWAGVARYKATGDATALRDTAKRFTDRYKDSSWAKKASVWAA
jgi:tetratricopeptide (TPR) repeat protein